MYIDVHPLYLILVTLFFTFIHSATSRPIQPRNWIERDQYEDSNSLEEWKVLEKDHHPMADPSHPNSDLSPIWRIANINDELREQEVARLHTNGDSSSRNPVASVVIPASPEKSTKKIHKPDIEHLPTKWTQNSELEESTKKAIAADQKHRYEEALRQIDIKNALSQKNGETVLASSPRSSGLTISAFSYRFSIPFPTLKLQEAGLLGHPLSQNFATVIILLVLVWIAMFLVGLFELGNYLWSRPAQIVVENIDGNEEQDVELGELAKTPSSIVTVSIEKAVASFPQVTEFESLEVASSDSESDTGSDENDHDHKFSSLY